MKNYNSITIIHEDNSLPLFKDDDNNTTSSTSLLLSPLSSNKHQANYNPHPQDHLAPPFSACTTTRPSSLLVGTFNLIATIIGGGVLSLPIAFQKCGIFTTTLFMLTSAYMTYMSLISLCYASRRCGGSSYGEVVRSAFGERMEEGVSWLLFIFLLFVIAAYMVLIRDIWTPLVGLVFDDVHGDRVLMGIIVMLLPFLFQRSLHALRWNCYIGFGSILVLCVALCRGGFQRYLNENDEDNGNPIYELRKNYLGLPTKSTKERRAAVLMSTMRLDSLPFRMGRRYLHVSDGDREISVFFTDVRVVLEGEDISRYPLVHDGWTSSSSQPDCAGCEQRPATMMTYQNELTNGVPTPLCEQCFRMLHYDKDGKVRPGAGGKHMRVLPLSMVMEWDDCWVSSEKPEETF